MELLEDLTLSSSPGDFLTKLRDPAREGSQSQAESGGEERKEAFVKLYCWY